MTSCSVPPDPFEFVAGVLGCSKEELSEESEIYKHYGWDSFGHMEIIAALEEALGISIDDDEVLELTTMRAICELFDRRYRTNGK